MKRENLLIGLVILLVLINAFVLFRFSAQRPGGGPPPHDKIIVKRLDLDEDQQRTFERLKRDHRGKIITIENKVEIALEQYFLLLASEDPSRKDSLETLLAGLERQKASVTYQHFADLKNMLRPDQQKAFNDFIPELSKFILPKGPPPPKD